MARVVSLLPSATEIVCALGCADDLVGISHECDFPDAIRDRRVLTRSRIAVTGTSASIDAAVRAVIRDALSIYEVDEDQLAALAPDVVVTQDLCEVCAVSLNDVRAAVARLAHRDAVSVVSLSPTRLDHVLEDIERVAAALDRRAEGAAVRGALEHRIRAIAGRAASHATRPRVVSLEWIEPLMIGGTWMPELIELAGGVACGAEAGAPAPTIDPAALVALRPDVVLVKPCGFTIERALAERDAIERMVLSPLRTAAAHAFAEVSRPEAGRPEASRPEVRSPRVYLTDGNAFFNRPGPRLVESLEIMAACVHPETFADFADHHAHAIRRLA
ncbi:MAG TPA: ABC transporter substrate-binding protein [Kofleriaceae bacterium]|nr:ABC transporter substrate-binding protein [Kofleriaceae bacterium]